MTASLQAKSNGTQGALQVNGVDAVVFEAGGIASGYKAGSITPAALSGNQSGSAPALAARAWCTFNGTLTGTNAPIAGANVASVTRNGLGDFTVNFTTPLSDADYAAIITARSLVLTYGVSLCTTIHPSTAPTSSSVRFLVSYQDDNSNAITYVDSPRISLVAFR
jgi:hypothetical protein